MPDKTLARLALLLLLTVGPVAVAAEQEVQSTVAKMLVTNQHLLFQLATQQPPQCATLSQPGSPGFGATANEDASFDRWISLLMLAIAEQKTVTIRYHDSGPNMCRVVWIRVHQ